MNRNRSAFTLVEILIVVVIMAVLAATIIPQFAYSAKDAQASTAMFNLQSLRSQIEMYKAQHNGAAPTTLADLTFRSKSSGATTTANDPENFPFGPYLLQLPENPFNNQITVKAITGAPAVDAGAIGWLYDNSTGKVYLNHADYLTR